MSQPLPDSIEPERLAARDEALAGELRLVSMPRLLEAILDEDGPVSVALDFYQDGQGRCRARGHIVLCLHLTCQRCLQAMELDIEEGIDVVFVSSESNLPEMTEAVLMDAGQVSLQTLIEDQILLALPFAPRHEEGACARQAASATEMTDSNTERRSSPFAVLAALKGQADK